MTALARGYSFVMYLAEAGATYTIPFPFLHTNDVRVFAGDAGDAVEQSVTWTGPTSIQLVGDVPQGILVTLRRFTKRDAALVVVADGAQLPAHDLNTNTKQLLYIIQEQIDFGTYGGSGIPGGGAGWPGSGGTTDPNIQQIIDQLMQSPVMGLLVSRLDDIDDLGNTMLEELLRSDQTFDERRKIAGRLALAETSLSSLTDDAHSVATQVTELFAKFDDAAAQFIQVNQALATETEARTTSVTQLNAAIGGNTSRITSAEQAIANEVEARSTAMTTLTAAYKAADGDVTTAINQTLQTTYATKDFAQSTAANQVAAFANGAFVNLQERFEALVDGTADPSGNPQWQANWTVRINAGSIAGVPVIAGIGLGVDSKTGSSFIVMADRFGIVSPTYTTTGGVGQMKYPFVVGTVGGVSTVGITGQLIVDGSVTADKIKVNSLSALTANMGEVNGGTFRTYQLDANGAIIDPLEFRAELTNKPGDSYPVWVGAGAKNWNNAVFAVDRSGNAKFAGTVSALNVTDQLQTQTSFDWSGNLRGSDGGSTASFTLPAPVRLGESHRPMLILELASEAKDDDGQQRTDATIVLEQLIGSTWTQVSARPYNLQKFDYNHSALVYSGAPTTAATTFRIRVSNVGSFAPSDFYLRAVSGYAFGLR
jgi:hypothetical protein